MNKEESPVNDRYTWQLQGMIEHYLDMSRQMLLTHLGYIELCLQYQWGGVHDSAFLSDNPTPEPQPMHYNPLFLYFNYASIHILYKSYYILYSYIIPNSSFTALRKPFWWSNADDNSHEEKS